MTQLASPLEQKNLDVNDKAIPKDEWHNYAIETKIVNCIILKKNRLFYIHRGDDGTQVILKIAPMPSKATRSKKRGWINSLWTFFEQVKW